MIYWSKNEFWRYFPDMSICQWKPVIHKAFSRDLVFSLSLIILVSLAKSLNFNCNSFFNPTVPTPPHPPAIGGDDVSALIDGHDVMLTCTSTGAYPAPRMRWRLDGEIIVSNNFVNIITEITESEDERFTVISSGRFRASREWNQRALQCEVTHEALQEPQEVDVTITVLCKCCISPAAKAWWYYVWFAWCCN